MSVEQMIIASLTRLDVKHVTLHRVAVVHTVVSIHEAIILHTLLHRLPLGLRPVCSHLCLSCCHHSSHDPPYRSTHESVEQAFVKRDVTEGRLQHAASGSVYSRLCPRHSSLHTHLLDPHFAHSISPSLGCINCRLGSMHVHGPGNATRDKPRECPTGCSSAQIFVPLPTMHGVVNHGPCHGRHGSSDSVGSNVSGDRRCGGEPGHAARGEHGAASRSEPASDQSCSQPHTVPLSVVAPANRLPFVERQPHPRTHPSRDQHPPHQSPNRSAKDA
mmetsp:Transcript_8831/g.17647  ORF Transcript_8831/g.17647 Transcript_8831/m.17647 type:complete len:274 (+) Transcript_8831:913-1734(+)